MTEAVDLVDRQLVDVVAHHIKFHRTHYAVQIVVVVAGSITIRVGDVLLGRGGGALGGL